LDLYICPREVYPILSLFLLKGKMEFDERERAYLCGCGATYEKCECDIQEAEQIKSDNYETRLDAGSYWTIVNRYIQEFALLTIGQGKYYCSDCGTDNGLVFVTEVKKKDDGKVKPYEWDLLCEKCAYSYIQVSKMRRWHKLPQQNKKCNADCCFECD
jgi:hypothetical protein